MVKVSSTGRHWNGSASPPLSVFPARQRRATASTDTWRVVTNNAAPRRLVDPIADKGLLLSGIITLSISNWSEVDPEYGRFPPWFPVLVITRDAVILVGAAILHYFIGNKMKVKPSWTGKVAKVCQMCAIAWVMLQLRFLPLWFVVTVAGIFTRDFRSNLCDRRRRGNCRRKVTHMRPLKRAKQQLPEQKGNGQIAAPFAPTASEPYCV